MPHTRSHLPLHKSADRTRREGPREKNLGPGRRFVPGVAAGICRRPDDRPKAETHPPNASINVCLVNSGKRPESWRLMCLFPTPQASTILPSLSVTIGSSLAHLLALT